MTVDRPIFVVGSCRSGTTMMRRVLSKHPGIAMQLVEQKWLWKYGHVDFLNDRLTPADATPEITAHIRAKYEAFQREAGEGCRVGDKTNCNALRVAYVHHTFPDCRIVHMVRDGRAAAVSSREHWLRPGMPTARKLLNVPFTQKVRMVGTFVSRRVKRLFRKGRPVSPWGPCVPGIEQAMKKYSLIEVCGIQWRDTVTAARTEGNTLGPAHYLEVRYEDWCSEPQQTWGRLRRFLDVPPADEVNAILETIYTKAVDAWRTRVTDEDLALLMKHIEPTLREFGYL